ncbi:hypothetical protein C5S53_17040 [Methanophagales archaeon]|nr:hypothetical protein C5S53_17040 [Methanophagales archaeon]
MAVARIKESWLFVVAQAENGSALVAMASVNIAVINKIAIGFFIFFLFIYSIRHVDIKHPR